MRIYNISSRKISLYNTVLLSVNYAKKNALVSKFFTKLIRAVIEKKQFSNGICY